MPIPPQKAKYTEADFSPSQGDEWQRYLPDAVVDALLGATKPGMRKVFETHLAMQDKLVPLDTHRLLIPEPQLTLEQSFELVAKAYENFDPRLGAKVRELIADPARWKLGKAEKGEAWGHNDDGPDKTKDRAIIEYFHDGTISDPIYIAHELGHLMASDFASDAGLSPQEAFRITPSHLWETQGFFGQYVLYDYLMSGQQGEALKKAATTHFIGEITRDQYDLPALVTTIQHLRGEQVDSATVAKEWLGPRMQEFSARLGWLDPYIKDDKNSAPLTEDDKWHRFHQLHGGHTTGSMLGAGLFHIAKQDAGMREKIIDTLLVDASEKRNIVKVLDAAGVDTEEKLKVFARDAVADMTAPLLALATPKPAARPQARLSL